MVSVATTYGQIPHEHLYESDRGAVHKLLKGYKLERVELSLLT